MRDVEPSEAKNAAGLRPRVEWLLGVAIALMLAVAAIPGVRPLADRDPANATARGLEGLLRLARDEASQTGEDHIVFFEHAAGGGLVGTDRRTPVISSGLHP